MKNNISFMNLAEQKFGDIDLKLRQFIHEQLGLKQHTEFRNIPRFDKRVNNIPRPVVAGLRSGFPY